MSNRPRRVQAIARALRALLRVEAGFGLVEAVVAMSLFLIAGTALSDVLTTSVNSHGFAMDQTLGQAAADAQIEDIRALPYDSVGLTGGNPPGSVAATESATAVGISGLNATVTTDIQFVGDGIPDGYNQLTNYKEIAVTVTRNSDGRQLASETTFIAPPTRAPYGGINQVALGVTVTDIGDNEPVSGIPIALGASPSPTAAPSAPRTDTTDTNGGVLFAGMTANPNTSSYYTVQPTLPPGYVEQPTDTKQASLAVGQLTNLSLRVYQEATIDVNVTQGGVPYGGPVTITITPTSGSPMTSTPAAASNGQYSFAHILPQAEYTVVASTAGGLISKAVVQQVPNAYPTDLTSTFNLDLGQPTGTLSVKAVNGTDLLQGVGVTVTGGPSSVTLTGTTDASGVANFPSIPASAVSSYTVTGTYGAATFQNTGVIVNTNKPTLVTLTVPANGVTVSVTDGATPAHALQGVSLTLTGPNGFSAVATTDGTGTWTFKDVGQGSGYAVLATDGAATASATGIAVTSAGPTSVSLSLSVGIIHVNVKDSGGNALAGIPVTLTGPNSLVVIKPTDSTGLASFPNIGAGSGYAVSAADGAATANASVPPVVAQATTTVNLTLAAGSIHATITEGGSPLANAAVTVTGPNAFSATLTADATGSVTFPGVGAGSGYTVSATDGPGTAQQTGVSVTAGATTPVPLDIPAGSIKVTVTGGTTPLAGVAVTLTGAGGYTTTAGTTDSTGVYTFARVPAGAGFTVTATTAGGTASQTGVSVTASTMTPVAISMATGSIRAAVMINGAGFPAQTVTVTGPNSFSATGTTDSSGLAVFTGIPVGTGYTVSATYGSTIQVTGQTVVKNTRTDVLLTIPAGTLKVTVQNNLGVPVAGAPVTLATTNGITAPPGTTATDGTYSFNLPAATGAYKVTATAGAGTITSSSQTVTNGSTTNVTLTMPANSVQVNVKNQSSTGLKNATVTLTGPNSYSSTQVTPSSGTVTFTNVPAGASAYSVVATLGAGTATAPSVIVNAPPAGQTVVNLSIQTGTISTTVKLGAATYNGAAVTVTGPNGFTASGTTAGAGIVTFTNVPSGGSYTVATALGAASPQQAVNVSGTSTYPVTLTIPVGSISATVTLGGSAYNGASVTVTGPNGFTASGTTAGAGAVSFPNVPAGSGYTVATSVAAAAVQASAAVTSGQPTAVPLAIGAGTLKIWVKNSSSGCSLRTNRGVTVTGPNGFSVSGTTGTSNPNLGTVTFTNVPVTTGSNTYTATASNGAGTNSTITITAGQETDIVLSQNGSCT